MRAIRRDKPDLRKLARALVALAQAQVEADAQAEQEARKNTAQSDTTPPDKETS